jgi:nicotinate-nucleotide adenylyltransferase
MLSPQNPLKPTAGMADFGRRLEIARRVARHPRIVVSDIERQLGTSYTADTLMALARRRPRDRFVWLIGADNLAQIVRWRRWTSVMAKVPVAVFARFPYTIKALAGKAAIRYRRFRVAARNAGSIVRRRAPAWTFLPIRLHPASATAIRGQQGPAGAEGATLVRRRNR